MSERVFVVDRDAFFGGDWPQGYHPLPDAETFLEQAYAKGRFVERSQAEANPAWKQWIPYCMLRCGPWPQVLPSTGDETPATSPAHAMTEDLGVLVVQRTKKGGETRLHESWSIGLGGHIEPIDDDRAARPQTASGQGGSDLAIGDSAIGDSGAGSPRPPRTAGAEAASAFFATALARELSEELQLPETHQLPAPRLLGLINDDSTEVGKVHAGLAYTLDFPDDLRTARRLVGIREISKMQGAFTSLVELAKLWQTQSQFESWSQFLIQAEVVSAMGG